jgi:rhodanese-related sulfurtransferase
MADQSDVSPERAAELIRDGAQLVDVREPHEVEAGRLEGSRHVALGALTDAAESIERETPVLFYCLTGARSGMAAQAFRRAGYEAYNLTGGITAWDAAGLPIEGTIVGH